MSRHLSSLHIPFFGRALHEAPFAYSRKVAIETSLKIWCTAYPFSSILDSHSLGDAASSEREDLARLAICGSGFFRTVAMQGGASSLPWN